MRASLRRLRLSHRETDYGLGALVLGQADEDAAERGINVQRLLHERYALDIRD